MNLNYQYIPNIHQNFRRSRRAISSEKIWLTETPEIGFDSINFIIFYESFQKIVALNLGFRLTEYTTILLQGFDSISVRLESIINAVIEIFKIWMTKGFFGGYSFGWIIGHEFFENVFAIWIKNKIIWQIFFQNLRVPFWKLGLDFCCLDFFLDICFMSDFTFCLDLNASIVLDFSVIGPTYFMMMLNILVSEFKRFQKYFEKKLLLNCSSGHIKWLHWFF